MTPLQSAIKKALRREYPEASSSSDGEESFIWQVTVLLNFKKPERNVKLFYDWGRNWVYDFVFRERSLIVEIEGGVFSHGRHTRALGFTEDCRKYNFATAHGWHLLRFTTEMVKNGEALEIFREIQTKLSSPSDSL